MRNWHINGKRTINLIEIVIATSIMALGFIPIMNFFSNRAVWTRQVRVRNVGLNLAKNSLDFLIEDTPFTSLQFNQTLPDWDGTNSDNKAIICTDQTNQIFRVLSKDGKGYPIGNSLLKDGSLVGWFFRDDDKTNYWIKLLADPIIDGSGAIDTGNELVFKTYNWDRNFLGWPGIQAKDYHVLPANKTYIDLFNNPPVGYTKITQWDGRKLNPKPNSQGNIVPIAKVMVRVRWKTGTLKERKVEFESFKANLL